ncbi:hypothetical protein BGW36DRAFT_428936 [Talaromyces proteolyticus]|uniref:Tetraspanin n=1 Tax=Talaromyces proteolyticus TaxID=1131652 RepID=A0AAD4KKV5_9EURO|nr:uncharacterized protein BGW36DRAFT_428936 [Talaromyces proteolyticus]KAH8695044.1 hypothetical protein BGW36DRAFT_428936 [Talaromyces proteolyticus]
MKIDKVLLSYGAADFLFLGGGVILLIASLLFDQEVNSTPTSHSAPKIILLRMVPFKAGLINAILVFATFAISIPSMILRESRFWLKLQGWMIVACGTFTLVLGLIIWIETLKTRAELGTIWGTQPTNVQSLLQQEFGCCGYFNSTSPPFVTDNTCTTALNAAGMVGCVGPFSNFANRILDFIFTAAFGIVAIDMILLIAVAVVVKDRKEKERFRFIDAKVGYTAI